MVSLLQDQVSIKFPSSDTLDGDRQDDLMQTQGDSSPAEQQADNPSFGCQAYDPDGGTERKSSDSSHSPSPSSPAHDPLHGRFPASHAIRAARSKFKPTHSLERCRRYSYDENTAGTYGSFLKSSRNPFHPYKRQISEEVFPGSHQALALDDHAFKHARSAETFEELPGPTGTGEAEAFPPHGPTVSAEHTWCSSLQYSARGPDPGAQAVQDSEVSLKALSLEGQPGLYCYQPQVQEMYCPSHPLQQYSPGSSYPVTYLPSPQYPYQRIAPQGSQESHQPLFPKPIYSYSILIFMALKNSKTGSLPVSEIYNFMTEHFPYFKTAPDGWKNSVRHNLSLNKCFEKVENKSGSSSRKGCLWALNPAKVDKMQEELQKWKRKDPVAVRKSMAKPEELDTLIGQTMDKLRPSAMACNPGGLTSSPGACRQMLVQPHSLCDPPLSSGPPPALHAIHPPGPLCAKNPLPGLLGGHHSSCYASSQGFPPISATLMQQSPGMPQTIFPSGDTQSELRAQPSTTQDSPVPAQTPPIHGMKMLTEHSATRTMQDALMQDGDLSNDIDALNPSLTDFDLQGNLWEELKDDSLGADPLGLISASQCLPPHCPVDGGAPHASVPDLQLTTLYSAFLEVDAVPAPYLSSPGSKPIALV